MTITVRPATAPDCVDVAAIYKHYVDNTVVTFDYVPPTAADWKIKRANLISEQFPFLVAEDENHVVVGFAYVAHYRPKQAYAWTVENTIYLSPAYTGQGYGATLLTGLLDAVKESPAHRVVSVIADIPGSGSVPLHAKAGFYEVGRLRRIGYKHGSWVDCIVMQYDVVDSDRPPY